MQEGEKVPGFTLPDQDGVEHTLSDELGKPVVLFFYPRADTPGCTVEACEFNDWLGKLEGAGAVVWGISRDTVKAQKKFADKFGLKYPLLADPDEKVCNLFGVMRDKTMYGKPVRGIERTTFVIDQDGTLRKIFPKVTPEGHAAEVLAVLDAEASSY